MSVEPSRDRSGGGVDPENQSSADGRLLSEMDFFNNDVGRKHGARDSSDDALVQGLQSAIANGDLKAVRFGANGATSELVDTDACSAATPCGR